MRSVLRLLTGYLTVEISGYGAELLFNRAAAKRIVFRSLRYNKRKITGCISISDFKQLPELRRGTGADIHIVGKHGIPFLIHRYRYRYGLPIGAAAFIIVLLVLSQFVWSVEIEGNNTVSEKQLSEICGSIGIRQGMLRSELSAAVDAQRLLLNAPELSWAALNLEGSVLTVSVSEIKKELYPEDLSPCDLRAAADGTVVKIDITAGEPAVRVGDTVRKGDVLVSGIKESPEGTSFVQASGTVTARTQRLLSAERKRHQINVKYTGQESRQQVISFFGIKIPLFLGSPRGGVEECFKEAPLVIKNRRLPISLYERCCRYTESQETNCSETQLRKQLLSDAEAQQEALKLRDCEIISDSFEETEDGMRIARLISATEDIAVSEKILIAEQ